jgi:hypothetical protein
MALPRPTPRGWTVIAALLLLTGTLVVVLVSRGGGPPCSVTASGRTVELGRDDAERAAVAVAHHRVTYGDTAAATTEVRRATDLSARDAGVVGAALSGEAKAALVCDGFDEPSGEPDTLGAAGLTARAERIRTDLRDHFRSMALGGFAPGGVRSGHMPGSAHYEGRAIDAFSRPISATNKTRGWALAQYLVARAEHFDIDTVIFDDRIWTSRRGAEGWRDYRVDTTGKTRAVARVLEHRDHVHVDVAD